MLTIVYVPPGRDGYMIDTFFHVSKSKDNNEAMIGLADPEMRIDNPCIGDVQTEKISDSLSERARTCFEYCRSERPEKYKENIKALGALAEKYALV